MINDLLYVKALSLATKNQEGQKDKAGEDYMNHPKRVAEKCQSLDEKVTALLHDVIEDTDITTNDLKDLGFPHYIIESILSVTKRENEDYMDFILRSKPYIIGRNVQIQYVLYTMDINRFSCITYECLPSLPQYSTAFRVLIVIITS